MPSALLTRCLMFWLAWIGLAGPSAPGLAVGLAAAACATAASLRLLPAGPALSPLGLARFVLRFLGTSVQAGIDVARVAFDPALPLAPGFVEHPTRRREGPGRDALEAVMSLQPGTLPVGRGRDGSMLVHCLDRRKAVAAQLAADEAAFDRIQRPGGGHG